MTQLATAKFFTAAADLSGFGALADSGLQPQRCVPDELDPLVGGGEILARGVCAGGRWYPQFCHTGGLRGRPQTGRGDEGTDKRHVLQPQGAGGSGSLAGGDGGARAFGQL